MSSILKFIAYHLCHITTLVWEKNVPRIIKADAYF